MMSFLGRGDCSSKVGMVVVLGAAALCLHASPAPCVNESLQAYESLGAAGCSIGGLVVNDFVFGPFGLSVPVSAQNIDVTIVTTKSSAELIVSSDSLQIQSGFANYALAYNVVSPVNMLGFDVKIEKSIAVPPSETVVNPVVCIGATYTLNNPPSPVLPNCAATNFGLTVFDDGINPSLEKSIGFNDGARSLGVFDSIHLGIGSSQLSSFSNTISVAPGIPGIPEPGSVYLLLGAILVVGVHRVVLKHRTRRHPARAQ